MRYLRTVIKIEVLSEMEDGTEMYEPSTLNQVVYDITEGGCSGVWNIVVQEEITPLDMARALLRQGSDAEFFQLNHDGTPLEEE